MSIQDHTNTILEDEIPHFVGENEMYELVNVEGNTVTIKALNMEDGLPWGFHLANIMGDIIGPIMPYGKTKLETLYEYTDDPLDSKITVHFDMRSIHKSGIVLKYAGTVAVIRHR